MSTMIKTVSVGIPAHNEESNIANLIKSILAQDARGFLLERIIIVCDGCTDGTAKVVKELAGLDNRIILMDDGKRFGKKKRLMQIYARNKSDVLAVFDADVVLANNEVIENLLVGFDDKQTVLVGGNNQPVKAENFVGKLVNTWSRVWYEARLGFNGGDNIHNVRGCVLALRRDFAQEVQFPQDIVSDAQYLYFLAKSKSFGFRLAKDAIILYRKPNNVSDYFLQTRRLDSQDDKLAKIFGNVVFSAYKIPIQYKLKALFKMMLQEPVFTPLSAMFYISSVLFPYRKPDYDNGAVWKMVSSTKRGIEIPNF